MHNKLVNRDISQNLIVGTGGHGKVVYSTLRALKVKKNNIYFIDGFRKRFETFMERPVLGGLEDGFDVSLFKEQQVQLFWGYGGTAYTGNKERRQMYIQTINFFKEKGYKILIPPLIHPSAVFLKPYPMMSQGICICARTSIGPDVTIHKGVIINTGSIIEHDVTIGEFTQIASGTVILGGATIEKNVFIGGNATIAPGITIGENSIIGMGSVITKDVEPNTVVYGVPGKTVKKLEIEATEE